MYQSFIRKFNSISFNISIAVCALLPLFFLPVSWGGTGAVKGVLLYGAVFIAFSFWLLAQFVGGSIRYPRHKIYIWMGVWLIGSFLSAILSSNSSVSLWGNGFVIDSFATTLVLLLFTVLIASFAQDQQRLIRLFLATFIGSTITVFLQVALYLFSRAAFVANHLSHVATQGTLVGSWVDFAYFVTFTFVLALLMYEVLIPKGFFKKLSLISLILSLLVLVFLNFKAAWIIAIISSLLVFVYKSSVERSLTNFFGNDEQSSDASSRFPLLSFVALLIGLFFFLSSGSIGAGISRSVGIVFGDVRPSFGASAQVVGATYRHDPVFGAGPGRFGQVWDLYHSASINQTSFWNTSFDRGYSHFTTIATTNGPIVAIAVGMVIVLALLLGIRLFNTQFPDRFSRFIAVTSLIMVIAFAGLVLFSSPGIVLVVFGLFFLGLLLGVAALVGKIRIAEIHYLKDPRTSFFAILLLVVATMSGFTAVYFVGNRFASILIYNRAISSASPEEIQRRLDRALTLSQNDVYWRTRAALFTRQFTTNAAASSPDKTLLQSDFSQAEQSAKSAVAWDSTNAANWLTLSQIYQLVSNPESADAYSAAKQAAEEAQKLNPRNPFYLLNQAQVAMTKKDMTGARGYIEQALVLKPAYLDAYVLRAQIRQSEGDSSALVSELTAYTKVAFNDPQGYTLLGQAYIAQKNYQSALDMFTRARALASNDPNTYLAVIDTLTLMGQKSQALDALDTFAKVFPNITGVEQKRTQIQSAALPSIPTTEADSSTKEETKKKK